MRKTFSLIGVVLAGQAGLAGLVSPPASAATAEVHSAVLITGDRVTVRTTPDGRDTFDIQPAAAKGVARSLVHLRLGGQDYEVPGTALPYLGRGLDLSLFDVKALLAGRTRRAGPRRNHRLGGREALAGRWGHEGFRRRAGASSSPRTTRVATSAARACSRAEPHFGLAGAKQPKAVQPRSVMRTVSVDAKDIAGKPADTGVAFLYNTDDGDLLDPNENLNYFSGGTAKFSAPEGNYSALGPVLDRRRRRQPHRGAAQRAARVPGAARTSRSASTRSARTARSPG